MRVDSDRSANDETLLPQDRDLSEEFERRKPSILHEPGKNLITILLIGETGSGKTSFMSLVVNLFRGNGPLELQEVHFGEGESGLSKNQSQTTSATMYTITTWGGATIRLLDTPGLADTRGLDQDEKHKAEINKAIRENVATIDAVLILANGSVQRLTAATNYTLQVITTMFPHSILDNIGFVFTNSDELTLNFEEDSLPEELRNSPRWLIQNPLAMLKNYNKNNSASQSNAARSNRLKKQLELCYDDSVATLSEWIKWVDERNVQPTHEIDRLYHISTRIEAHLEGAVHSLSTLAAKRQEYEELSSKLETNKQEKQAIEDLIKKQTATEWVREDCDEPNTICIAPGCNGNCHLSCSLPYIDSTSELGRHCQAFGGVWTWLIADGSTLECEVCGHKAAEHRHYYQRHVRKNCFEIDGEIKKKLDSATTEQGRLEAAKAATQRRIAEIDAQSIETQDTIRSLVDDFHRLSLSNSFAGHMNSAIQMLKLRRKGLEGKPNTQAEIELIDQSIEKFQQKVELLAKPASLRDRVTTIVGGVLSSAARLIPGLRGRRVM